MLRMAITSVLNQSYQHLEVIVQDDSTGQECARVACEFNDFRLIYHRNSVPLGAAANLRSGYLKATGRYLATLNDDDIYAPDYVAVLVGVLESNPSLSLAFCDHYLIDHEGAVLEQESIRNTQRWRRCSLKEGPVVDPLVAAIINKSVPAMFAMFRKSAIDLDDFPDEVGGGYDYWLTYLAVRDGNPIYYVPRRLSYYRVHSGSQTANFKEPSRRLEYCRYDQFIHRKFLSDSRLTRVHRWLVNRLANSYSTSGFVYLRMKRRRSAAQEFVRSISLSMSARGCAGLCLCVIPHPLLRVLFRL
jgi:glycosyltransferase involved in cell wall biosynthesis